MPHNFIVTLNVFETDSIYDFSYAGRKSAWSLLGVQIYLGDRLNDDMMIMTITR